MEDFVDEEEDEVDLFTPGNNPKIPKLENAAKSVPASAMTHATVKKAEHLAVGGATSAASGIN